MGHHHTRKLTARQQRRAEYNQGYMDAVNNRPQPTAPAPSSTYLLGYAEGLPKRLVPTYVSTPRGPVMEHCTIERASYLLASNRTMPGGRR